MKVFDIDNTEITSSSFEQWAEDFKRNHPIRHWIDSLYPDGICGYATHYFLSHPWIFFPWAWRRMRWAYQRVFRGWDDRVIWSIDYHLAEMIPIWLLELKKNKRGVPSIMFSRDDYTGENYEVSDEVMGERRKEYDEILQEIRAGFLAWTEIDEECLIPNSDEYEELCATFEKGFDLFKEYFGTLWD